MDNDIIIELIKDKYKRIYKLSIKNIRIGDIRKNSNYITVSFEYGDRVTLSALNIWNTEIDKFTIEYKKRNRNNKLSKLI